MPEWKREITGRLAALELEPARESEIVEELSQHLEDRYAESLANGATPEEAFRAALAELNSDELLTRELRRVERSAPPEPTVLGANWRGNMFGGLWQDLRFASRMLRKNPGFTVVATLTLALGIGANTAIFTLMDAVLLRRLPVKHPEQLIELMTVNGKAYNSFSWQAFQQWRQRNQSLSGLIASSNSRFYLLSSCFSGLALFIAAVGLYGVLSYTVARRTREIGIRMALGARSRDVMAMILKEITWLVCLGLAFGVPLALILGRFVADLLYGLAPTDPLTIVAGILVMLIVALLAGYVPARRASRVGPMASLRCE